MQKNEIIIEKFITTIQESSLDVQGDAVLLNNVFKALEKKKKRKRFLAIFMMLTLVSTVLTIIIWGNYSRNNEMSTNKSMVGLTTHNKVDLSTGLPTINEVGVVGEQNDILPKKRTSQTLVKIQEGDLTVSYKFNNHQVDVHTQESEEFIQINVFGSDGSELDVFKMMEDLKNSYRKNELYVDSVSSKPTQKIFRSVRRPLGN
jgi:hypothetical protein